MEFELDETQGAIADAARALLAARSTSAAVRVVVDAGGGLDAGLWDAVVEQGWLGLTVAEVRGGLGLGFVEAAVVIEQLGAHVAPVPYVESLLALRAVERAGGEAAGRWLEGLLQGALIGAVSPAPTAQVDPDGRLSGRVGPVLFAPSADLAVVAAAGPDGPALFVVDEVASAAEPAMDRTRELGWLDLDDAHATRLGGRDAVEALVDDGATAYSASLLGQSQRMLDLSVEHARTREQFGRPIGSFQAVKHRCADMLVDVEGMRSAAYWAAWCVAAEEPDRSVAASTAKVWCSDAAERVMASGLQVHGGIGFTWEHDVHLYLKRAQLDGLAFGDATTHRDRLSALLRARVEAGESVV